MPDSDPPMSPRIPSSVNMTFDNMINDPGNLMPFIANRSRSRIASTPLGSRTLVIRQETDQPIRRHLLLVRTFPDTLLGSGPRFRCRTYRVAQGDHQEQQREMPALVAAQAFPQCPVDNGQFPVRLS